MREGIGHRIALCHGTQPLLDEMLDEHWTYTEGGLGIQSHALAPVTGLRSHRVEYCCNLDVALAKGDDIVLGSPAALMLPALIA